MSKELLLGDIAAISNGLLDAIRAMGTDNTREFSINISKGDISSPLLDIEDFFNKCGIPMVIGIPKKDKFSITVKNIADLEDFLYFIRTKCLIDKEEW